MPCILMTGGSGRLGSALQDLLPQLKAPSHRETDITQPESLMRAFETIKPDLVVHAAAYTDVAGAERQPEACWHTNVVGTRNLVAAVRQAGLPLVHISTDYVFYGDTGMYREDDVPGPVRNYYALSKLVAEEVVRTLPDYLIVRTSFRPERWPYPVAFEDLYTSQDYVDVIAPEIVLALRHYADIPFDTLHIATERKGVFELAQRRKPDVRPGSKADAAVALPDDISLDISRWQALKARWEG